MRAIKRDRRISVPQYPWYTDPLVAPFRRFDVDIDHMGFGREPTAREQEYIDEGWEEYDQIVESSIVSITGAIGLVFGFHPMFSKPARYIAASAAIIAGVVATGAKWTMQLTEIDEWALFHFLEDRGY